MRHIIPTVALVLGLVGQAEAASVATKEPRVALVIGNSSYRESPLANPANDAKLMTKTLRALGFDVIERIDADQKMMKRAIIEFGDRLNQEGKDAVGLFFYAGHGLQVNGRNYLVPLKADIDRESHVDIEAVSASWILGEMEFAGNRVNFVILDACRNNPLTRRFRSPARGLARMDAPRGSLIAYSTAPGQVARDGTGANSPYAAALSQAMQKPGVPVEKMFKLVRNTVIAETKQEQTPWEESSLTGKDFYFNPVAAAPAAPLTTPQASTTAIDLAFWKSIRNRTNPADFEAYLAKFPQGNFAILARSRIETLKSAGPATPAAQAETQAGELAFWASIKGSTSPSDYEAYLQRYPQGNFAPLARARLAPARKDMR